MIKGYDKKKLDLGKKYVTHSIGIPNLIVPKDAKEI